jgi:hypothetical protein
MDGSAEPDDDSTASLLTAKARECAELRELLGAVAGELERLACEQPALASRLLARAQRIRRRLWEAGG